MGIYIVGALAILGWIVVLILGIKMICFLDQKKQIQKLITMLQTMVTISTHKLAELNYSYDDLFHDAMTKIKNEKGEN